VRSVGGTARGARWQGQQRLKHSFSSNRCNYRLKLYACIQVQADENIG
jgi:hypothetical protein